MGTIVKAPIGIEDVKFKDSGTTRQTFTRTDSNSRTLTLNKIDIKDLQYRSLALGPEDLIDGGFDVDIKPKRVFGQKGGDIASAGALALGTDGNYFDVTGTTTITSIGTVTAGFVVTLHFDGVLTLTHGAALVLPSGNNIVTKAGDELTFIEFSAGSWRCVSMNRPIDSKGADVASTGVLPVLAPGFFDVTGTNTITSIADIGIGSKIVLQFDGVLTITHNATDLILPSGNNIVTRAGDILEFTQYAAGDWVMTASNRPIDAKLADVASAGTLPVLAPGFMDVTGTTGITLIADIGIGSKAILQFDGVLTITHHATNLILPSGNNIVTRAGDILTFVQYAAGDWVMVSANRPLDAKLADVASAAALPVLGPGFMDVTGAVTITTIADIGIGSRVSLQFDAALTITHHATNLILPDGRDILTVAGEVYEFIQYAAGDWIMIGGTRTSGMSGQVIQSVHSQEAALETDTTVMPLDDTIPQNTEGFEVLTQAITPTNANNTLVIEALVHLCHSNSTIDLFTGALFQDSTAGALAASFMGRNTAGDDGDTLILRHEMVAGTTSSTTFKIRAGSSDAGTLSFNGQAAARLFGGVIASSIRITEYKI